MSKRMIIEMLEKKMADNLVSGHFNVISAKNEIIITSSCWNNFGKNTEDLALIAKAFGLFYYNDYHEDDGVHMPALKIRYNELHD